MIDNKVQVNSDRTFVYQVSSTAHRFRQSALNSIRKHISRGLFVIPVKRVGNACKQTVQSNISQTSTLYELSCDSAAYLQQENIINQCDEL